MTGKNSFNVLIGKSVARTANVQITDPTASSTYIANGEVVVLNHLDAPLTPGQTISDSPYIRLVQRSGDKLVYSARISGTSMRKYTGKSGSAGQEQIYILGYNGSSGSIDMTTVSKLFKLVYTHDELMYSMHPNRKTYQAITSTQANQADEIATIMNQDSYPALMGSGAAGGFISATILVDNAAAALGAGTVSVVKGSPIVTASSASHGLTAGEWIRIGSVATTTDPVYKVQSVSGTEITLTMPFQGSTATGVTAGQIDTTSAATMNAGVKMTGLALTSGIPPYGEFKYMRVAFTVAPGTGFGATTITKTQEMSRGNGTFPQVREYEYMSLKFEGMLNQSTVPLPSGRSDATSGVLYDTIVLTYSDTSEEYAVSGTRPAPQDLYIFLADGASQQADIRAQLNPWMNSVPAGLASVSAL